MMASLQALARRIFTTAGRIFDLFTRCRVKTHARLAVGYNELADAEG
jgi:hypothetical protein